MNPKKQILEYIQTAYTNNTQPDNTDQSMSFGSNVSHNETLQELFDGMSSGTARIVIEQELSRQVLEAFDISPLENKGRYYVAKILRPDGSSIQRLLVDKQTGNVQMVGH